MLFGALADRLPPEAAHAPTRGPHTVQEMQADGVPPDAQVYESLITVATALRLTGQIPKCAAARGGPPRRSAS